MPILKVHIPIKLLKQLVTLEQTFFDCSRVEEELGTCGGVDEGGDEFVEGGKEEGDVDDEGAAEALGVVGLEKVEKLWQVNDALDMRRIQTSERKEGVRCVSVREKDSWVICRHSRSSV